MVAFQKRCFQFSQYLLSWVWKIYTGWYRFLSQLHYLKLFIFKKDLHLFRLPRFLLKSFFFLSFFILSFKIYLFLKLIFFTFYLVIMFSLSLLRVLKTLICFIGTFFLIYFFHWFFLLWFHCSSFWFLKIVNHYFF